jgi:hypothetical protein
MAKGNETGSEAIGIEYPSASVNVNLASEWGLAMTAGWAGLCGIGTSSWSCTEMGAMVAGKSNSEGPQERGSGWELRSKDEIEAGVEVGMKHGSSRGEKSIPSKMALRWGTSSVELKSSSNEDDSGSALRENGNTSAAYAETFAESLRSSSASDFGPLLKETGRTLVILLLYDPEGV